MVMPPPWEQVGLLHFFGRCHRGRALASPGLHYPAHLQPDCQAQPSGLPAYASRRTPV